MKNDSYDNGGSDEEEEFEKQSEQSEELSGNNEDGSGELSNQDSSRKESDEYNLLEESKKIVEDFFSLAQSSLPPRKEDVEELKMLLPGHGTEKQTVVVRLSKPRDCGAETFEKRYKKQMRRTIRGFRLQELKARGDKDAIIKFLKAEMVVRGEGENLLSGEAEEDGEGVDTPGGDRADALFDHAKSGDNENDTEEEDEPRVRRTPSNGIPGTSGYSFPYWLPHLLSNDLFYLELACETMFGWALPPSTPTVLNTEPRPSIDSKNNPSSMPILLVRGKKSSPETDTSLHNRVSFIHTNSEMQGRNAEEEAENIDENEEEFVEEVEEGEVKEDDETQKDEDEGEGREGYESPFLSPRAYRKTMKMNSQKVDNLEQTNPPTEKEPEKDPTSVVPLSSSQHQAFLTPSSLGMTQNKAKTTTQASAGGPASPEVVAFPDVNYKLYVVWEENNEEWQLLDVHPLIVEHRAQQKLLRKSQDLKRKKLNDEEEEEEKKEKSDDEEVGSAEESEETNSGEDENREEEQESEDEEDDVPSFDYESVIVLDALMLAALRAPSFLKTCFLQNLQPKEGTPAVSLECIEHWLVTDEEAGFPMLTAIYTGLMNARLQHSVTPLPYEPPALQFDFNYFFQEGVIFQVEKTTTEGEVVPCRRLLPGSSTLMLKKLNSLTNARSKVAMDSMRALLSANVVPSRPISLNVLTSPESLELALWLLACISERLLYVWGEQAKRQKYRSARRSDEASRTQESKAASEFDEDDDEEDADEEDGEEGAERYRPRLKKLERAEEAWRRQMLQKIRQLWHNADAGFRSSRETRNTSREGLTFPPALLPGPLLFSALVEIRCRMERERLGRKPLSYPINADMEKFMEGANLEDGFVDPLVTSGFHPHIDLSLVSNEAPYEDDPQLEMTGIFAESKTQSKYILSPRKPHPVGGTQPPPNEGSSSPINPPHPLITQRYQKIYQSDLVLLLLACTETPMPRDISLLYPPGTDDAMDSPKEQAAGITSTHDGALSVDTLMSTAITKTLVKRTSVSKGQNIESRESLTSSKCMLTPTSNSIAQSTVSAVSGVLTYNLIYFNSLLQAKIAKQQNSPGSSLPLTKARSGMWRLLFLHLPCFLNMKMIQDLCDAAPLYELFGVNDRCPLHELVYYWALEVCKTFSRRHSTGERCVALIHAVDIFVNAFCHELYHRLKSGLYPKNILSIIRKCSSSIGGMLSKVQDRMDGLQRVLSHLTGVRFRSAKGVDVNYVDFSLLIQQQNLQYRVDCSKPGSTHERSVESASEPPAASIVDPPTQNALQKLAGMERSTDSELLMKMIETTLVVASVYNEPFRSVTQRLVSSFKTLPMTERNIFTPELLFELLFAEPNEQHVAKKKPLALCKLGHHESPKAKKKELNFVAIRYVVVEKHITTVRERGPFASVEVAALEYAIRHGHVDAAALLVSLGASLADLVRNGAMTLETFLDRCWPAEKATRLRQLWQLQSELTRLDPEYQYSVLRPVV